MRPAWKKRNTKNVLGPRVSIWAATLRLMPVIAEAMAITTITPMATPRMVRAARTLLARSESRAMPMPSKKRVNSMVAPGYSDRRAVIGSSLEARLAG